MQSLIRLLVRKIEWQPEGNQTIEFFALPQLPQESPQIKNEKTSPETNQDWFATSVRYGCPQRSNSGRLILRILRKFGNITAQMTSIGSTVHSNLQTHI